MIAQHYPNASIVSLEVSKTKVQHHSLVLDYLQIKNNYICNVPLLRSLSTSSSSYNPYTLKMPVASTASTSAIASSASASSPLSAHTETVHRTVFANTYSTAIKNIFESPEFFRFQLLGEGLLELFIGTIPITLLL
jgi:hypothetical protein